MPKKQSRRSKKHAKKVEQRHSSSKKMVSDLREQLRNQLPIYDHHRRSKPNKDEYDEYLDQLLENGEDPMISNFPSLRATEYTTPVLSRKPSTQSTVFSRKPSTQSTNYLFDGYSSSVEGSPLAEDESPTAYYPSFNRYVSPMPAFLRKSSTELSPWANGESPSALSDFTMSTLTSSPSLSRRSSYQP